MDTLSTFQSIARDPFSPAVREEYAGRKIVGYFCSYVPEELILAAGMIPFRIRATGSTKTSLGDTWFSHLNCSYVRHLFDLALEGRFRFLDGLVFMNSCDHIRRMFDNWKRALDHPGFVRLLAVPHKRGPEAVLWYQEELQTLGRGLEEKFGTSITAERLRSAIRLSNRIREKLAALYQLRAADPPPITAAETLSVIMAGTALPRERFLDLLDQLLDELPGRPAYPPHLPRLMIVAGCLEEPDHLAQIEAQGCTLVDDFLCFGRRYFDRLVDETTADPWQALAERYLFHLSCPRLPDDWERRLERIREAEEEYRLDGVICEKLKFCDLWGGEAFILRHEAKADARPFLALERELYGGGEGQLRTRIQAFLERIGKTGRMGD